MRRLYYRVYIAFLSIKWVFRINLGDKVIWSGDYPWTYIVNNGVREGQWQLKRFDCDSFWVERSECKKIKTIPNLINSFKRGYEFYMKAWFDIWCRNGIEPWVKSCNIW